MSVSDAVDKAWGFADRAHRAITAKLTREYQLKLDEARNQAAARGTVLSGSMVMETAKIEGARISAVLRSRLDHLLEGLALYKADFDEIDTISKVIRDIGLLRDDFIAASKRNYVASSLSRLVPLANYSLLIESEVGLTNDEVLTEIERWRLNFKNTSSSVKGFQAVLQLGENGMPRRTSPQVQGPTLAAERSIPALEALIARAPEVKAQEYGSPMKKQWGNEAEALLAAALGENHSIANNFGRDFISGVYHPSFSEQRLKAQSDRQVDGGVAALAAAVQHLRLQLPDSAQVFLRAGSQHDAYTEIRSFISQAANEVLIVDTWVDHTLWPLLTNTGPNVKIRVLTENMKGDFLLEAKKFAAQTRKAVEVRQTKTYHDRFIVLDSKRVIHLGASIKDLGNKATMMSEISSSNIATATISDIEYEWAKAPRVQ